MIEELKIKLGPRLWGGGALLDRFSGKAGGQCGGSEQNGLWKCEVLVPVSPVRTNTQQHLISWDLYMWVNRGGVFGNIAAARSNCSKIRRARRGSTRK